jgi:hypothetical protein
VSINCALTLRKEINQMLSKIKVVLPVLGAVVTFRVLDAAVASAEWLVGGTVLSGSAVLLPQALVDATSTLLVPAVGLSIVCGGHFLDELDPLIIAPDKTYASSLTFLGCNVTAPASGCALAEKEQSIPTTAILARASLLSATSEEDRLLVSPETKGILANIQFSESNTCAFIGTNPLRDSFVVGAPTGRLDLLTQSLIGLGSVENNSLEFLGGKAFLDGGKVLMRLASDSK